MDAKRIQTSLEQIRKLYGTILDDNSRSVVLPSAIASVGTTRAAYDRAVRDQVRGITPVPWGYLITHDQPLRFKVADLPNGPKLQVDVYCDVKWANTDTPVKQDIKVRIWSKERNIIFDPDRDGSRIATELDSPHRNHPGRVIARFHLDKADESQKVGPSYHLQFGGKAQDYELCWHPKKVNVPRFEFRPMELFLTCQLIAANFFWNEYQNIREKSEWREQLIFYQNLLLKQHYEKCLNIINNRESLLDGLWVA